MTESLRQLQSDFLAAYQEGVEQQPAILKAIVSNDDFDAQQRWTVYRDSITAAFINTLAATFPVCERLVGEAFFAAMAKVAIQETISHSPDLNAYGEQFPDFIANFEHAKSLPYLADVARLEWAVHIANHGQDILPPDWQHLAEQLLEAGDTATFCLPANGTLLQSDFPVDKIWQVNQTDYIGDQSIQLEDDPCALIIWRRGFDLIVSRLDKQEQVVLQLFFQEKPLSEVAELATERAIDIAQLLPVLVQRGYLTYQGG